MAPRVTGPDPVPAPVPPRREPHGTSSGGRLNSEESAPLPIPSPEIAAEAAVWIARLHGPERSVQMERECRAWQGRSDMHRLAFERCTEVWEAVPGLTLADAFSAGSRELGELALVGRRRRKWAWGGVGLAGAALGLAVGAALLAGRGAPSYSTGIGEQRSVLLADGSRVTLNTNTRVEVDLTPERRTVRVEGGEALFEVAKDARRPFVVRALDSEVVALGTAFAVRLGEPATQGNALAVTLIEGRVSVRAASGTGGARAGAGAGADNGSARGRELTLLPGERVKFSKALPPGQEGRPADRSAMGMTSSTASGAGAGAGQEFVGTSVVTRDRPRIDQIIAWKRSEVVFDDVSLPEAVGEMNRYNREPIVLASDAALSRLRVSGSYRAGDSDGFARAAAMLHSLVVRRHDGRFELLRPQ
ncbi:MAG: DUF4880 domain-containing protein [Rubrivivax sp.]|nr:MAG: DUF4880 domain-containing protein [Rubrivivax sp.]